MDADKRSLRTIDTTLLPLDIEVTAESELGFSKLNFDMLDENLVKTLTVDCANLDFYKHVNNVEYVRLMVSTLDLDFLIGNTICDFEIHYLNECRFGDQLDIYKKDVGNSVEFEIRKNGATISKARLNYKNKK